TWTSISRTRSLLVADGLVTEEADGTLTTLGPEDAALHLDAKWDVFLDNLPDPTGDEGQEVERTVSEDEDPSDDDATEPGAADPGPPASASAAAQQAGRAARS